MAPSCRRIISPWILGLLILLPVGCGEDQLRRYDASVLALSDGRNETALADARAVLSSGNSSLRAQAAFVAGVAATRLDDPTTARRYLGTAVRSSDTTLSGRALVQLGVLERTQGNRLAAARSFEEAASKLRGEESGRALLLAAEDFQSAGRQTLARRCLDRATTISGANADKARIRLSSTGYAIQFGSFTQRSNAERQAAGVRTEVQRIGLGEVRIRRESGTWKVQAGAFPDRAAAGRALRRLARSDALVVAIGG
ncbi:MAG: SPOR domain-containing protein [Phycisphaerales bacterium]|nr:SPOR domain-containing protein [Phycisphaerales bacterium]